MNTGVISARYATALLKYAEESNETDQVNYSLNRLMNSYRLIPELRRVILNPAVNDNVKSTLLISACGEKIPSCLKDFLHFVLKKRRIEMLPFIVSSYISQYHKKKGLVTCKITTFCPIDEDTKERFKVIIGQKHHGKVEITTNVDSSLEGGFILEYDTYRLDASLKSQLQYIKRCLL